MGLRECRNSSLDRFDELQADRLAESPKRELKLDFVGDDVVLGAAVDRADRHDRRLARLDFAADDRLQVDDHERRQDDRVDRAVRPGAVAPFAANRDGERSRAGQRGTGAVANGADGLIGPAMQCQGEVGLGKPRVETVLEHVAAPSTASSAGWPTRTTVPDQRSRWSASHRAVPMKLVMWMSWPQACITPTSRPALSRVLTLLA